MTGSSGRQRIPADSLAPYLLAKPQDILVAVFGERISTLFDAIKSNDEMIKTLTQLRDLLLPELISGTIPLVAGRSGFNL